MRLLPLRALVLATAALLCLGTSATSHAQLQTGGVSAVGDMGMSENAASGAKIKQYVTTSSCTIALRTDGTLFGWGKRLSSSILNFPANATNIKKLAAGEDFVIALKNDGTLVGWGRNDSGQLNIPGGLSGVVDVAAGQSAAYAILSNGGIIGWTHPYYRADFVPASALNAIKIVAGTSVVAVLKANGTVVGWNNNNGGIYYNGNLTNVIDLQAAGGGAIALKTDGTVVTFGSNPVTIPPANNSNNIGIATLGSTVVLLKSTGLVECLGGGGNGEATPPPGLSDVVDVVGASNGRTAFAIKSDGTTVGWGNNDYGGANPPAIGKNIVQVSYADHTASYLSADGTVSMGGNTVNGEALYFDSVGGGIVQVSGGYEVTLFLRSDGTVGYYGYNSYGTGSIPGGLSGVAQVAAGKSTGAALKTDGTVVAWGNNLYGEATVPTALQIPGAATQVAGGLFHYVALRSDGTVTAWGDNTYGQTNVPGGLTNVVKVVCGAYHTVALKQDGTLAIWGSNSGGGVTGMPGGLTGVADIAAASSNNPGFGSATAALMSDGTVQSWGANPSGIGYFYINTDVQAVFGGHGSSWAALSPHTLSIAPNAQAGFGGTNYAVATVSVPYYAPVGGVTLDLAVSSGSGLGVPSTVTIPAGSMSTTFNVQFTDYQMGVGYVTATRNGYTSKAMVSEANSLSHLTFDRKGIYSGSSTIQGCTIHFRGTTTYGNTVYLTSSDPDHATVPVSILVPAGVEKYTFYFGHYVASAFDQITITASKDAESVSASYMSAPMSLTSLAVAPGTVQGGAIVTGTVTLNTAVSHDAFVNVYSSDPKVTVPVIVTIPAGQDHADFTINTTPWSTDVNATISAFWNGVSLNQPLLVTGYSTTVANLSIAPDPILETGVAVGTVTLSSPPPYDFAVQLSSNNPAATVPSTVVVLAGQVQATFNVTTHDVADDTTTTIGATLFNNAPVTDTLTVKALKVDSLAFDDNDVPGGTIVTGTVQLSFPVLADKVVSLSSANTMSATVPSTVTVLAGQSSATFPVTTIAAGTDTDFLITAILADSSKSAQIQVRGYSIASVSISPDTVAGGTNSLGTVTLNIAPPINLVVSLQSSASSAASVSSTVTVLANQTQATFGIGTSPVATATTATITATLFGNAGTDDITVNPPTVTGISVPAAMVGVQQATGTVTLSSPAPAGFNIPLASNKPAVGVPAFASFSAGAVTANFTITTTDTAARVTANITATGPLGSANGNVTVSPNVVKTFTVSPTQVVGGSATAVLGAVTITGAPYANVTVALSYSNTGGGVTGPSSVVVPAGQTIATFPVSHHAVGDVVACALTATRLNAPKFASLVVTPTSIISIKLLPKTVFGGSQTVVTGGVTLAYVVGENTTIALASDDTSAASVPATVTILAGQKTATFTVTHHDVPELKTANITATLFTSSQSAPLAVKPNPVAAHTLSPTSVGGGSPTVVTGTVTLKYVVGSDTLVTLTSGNASVATVPATVLIHAGTNQGTYILTHRAVPATRLVNIYATHGGIQKKATLTVNH